MVASGGNLLPPLPQCSLLCSPASLLLFLWLCSEKHVNPQPNRCFSQRVISGRLVSALMPSTLLQVVRRYALLVLIQSSSAQHLSHPGASNRLFRSKPSGPMTKSIPLTLVADMRGNTSHGLALLANLDESNAASHLYRALDKAHNFENTKAGQGKGGGVVNGMWVEGYSHLAEGASVRAMVRSLSRPDKKTLQVCEIGFNGGHSAANYLILNLFGLHVRYLGFDLGEHPYAHNARRFLQSLFGDKVDVIWGDSERTLRDFYAANPNFVCDVAMVDGLHTYHAALADTLNFLPLTRNGSMIAIDDMRHPQLVEAWRDVHKACPRSLRENGCAANKDWCQSWRTASKQGLSGVHFGLALRSTGSAASSA